MIPCKYPRMKSKLWICLAALILVFALAGCGDKNNGSSNDGTTQTTDVTGSSAETDSTDGAVKQGGIPKVSGSLKKKPTIAPPEGSPPAVLLKKDIKKGTGKKAAKGDKVTVQYVGISWSTGAQFDASWDRGEPFEFELGAGGVIKGWDEGVKGMREGGRRELVIPPDLAYGPDGRPPTIQPNETLVFVIDLVKVSK